METVTPRAAVMRLPYYPGAERAPAEEAGLCRLASNESALGPGAKAIEAYHRAASRLHRYPDPDWYELRHAIAGHYNLDAGLIVCGAGSEDLLQALAHAYLDPGDSVVHSEFGFPLYRMGAIAQDAVPVAAPEIDYRADVDALLAAVRPDTKLLFLANPNNPTGTVLDFEAIRALHAALPPRVLLVLDGAYAEYLAADPAYESGIRLVREGATNVVVTRTFSKFYGLASLRVGWAYGPPGVVEVLRRVLRYFGLNGAAQAAATAALDDAQHLNVVLEHNLRWRRWLEEGIRAAGFEAVPSAANFVLVNFPGGEDQAGGACRLLRGRGVIVRPGGPYGLPGSVRVSVGLESENRAFIDGLKSLRMFSG